MVNSKLISSNQPECGDRRAARKSEDPKGLNENMAPEEEVTETEQQKNDTVGDIESIAVLDWGRFQEMSFYKVGGKKEFKVYF